MDPQLAFDLCGTVRLRQYEICIEPTAPMIALFRRSSLARRLQTRHATVPLVQDIDCHIYYYLIQPLHNRLTKQRKVKGYYNGGRQVDSSTSSVLIRIYANKKSMQNPFFPSPNARTTSTKATLTSAHSENAGPKTKQRKKPTGSNLIPLDSTNSELVTAKEDIQSVNPDSYRIRTKVHPYATNAVFAMLRD
ncbi:hypothetical protein ACRALDRAFT_212368 [Sodiomyces alcalophilus JCM 7366]|uniref:uncharacterized protein n=1 Tax=Sodiomyces alcalophilus JCM 7366 TaxID=591952 RepID=UPI0039B42773